MLTTVFPILKKNHSIHSITFTHSFLCLRQYFFIQYLKSLYENNQTFHPFLTQIY